MKNYIRQDGFRNIPCTIETSVGIVTLTSTYERIIDRSGNKGYEGITADGRQVYVAATADRRKVVADNQALNERIFLARVPGIEEYLQVLADNEDYRARCNRDNHREMIPAPPTMTVTQAAVKYPIAAAYAHIIECLEMSCASEAGRIAHNAAQSAMQALRDGADIVDTAQAMDAEIAAQTDEMIRG